MDDLGTGSDTLKRTGEKRMSTLDPKNAAAILRKAKGTIGRRLTHFSNHCMEVEDRTPKR